MIAKKSYFVQLHRCIIDLYSLSCIILFVALLASAKGGQAVGERVVLLSENVQ